MIAGAAGTTSAGEEGWIVGTGMSRGQLMTGALKHTVQEECQGQWLFPVWAVTGWCGDSFFLPVHCHLHMTANHCNN